jgi:hypothetical protein
MMRPFYKTARLFCLLLLPLVVSFGTAAGEERVYYSVHLDTYKTLEAVNTRVNQLKEKGKTVFWVKSEAQGMGQVYRVYLGQYADWQDALVFWDRLKRSGAVDRFGIDWFVDETDTVPTAPPVASLTPDKGATPTEPFRFVDNGDGTITDTRTRLMWVQNGWRFEFLSALSWVEAREKIKTFKLNGHSDWRLPNIEEWRGVIDSRNRNPAMVEPNPFVNIISHMPYWTGTEYGYGPQRACTARCIESYIVMLYSGNINHQKKSSLAFVLPVRSLK